MGYPWEGESEAEARARWLEHIGALLRLESDGDSVDPPFLIAYFDRGRHLFIQATVGCCEVVSRSNAPEMTLDQENMIRSIGWDPPEYDPGPPKWYQRLSLGPPRRGADNWSLWVGDDVSVLDCIEACRRTAEDVFKLQQPTGLDLNPEP